jgi:co-chaperonin GroES (HSP10)
VEKLSEGTVLAAGAGGFDNHGNKIPMEVKPGDKVR